MRPRALRPRLPDWPERLAELIEARRHVPFAWGSNDCCLFAADAVLACTGEDPAADWRGRYSTEAEALALMDSNLGLYGLARAIQRARQAPRCPPSLAQRGDIALIIQADMPTMAVVVGEDVAAPSLDGLKFVPLALAERAWVT